MRQQVRQEVRAALQEVLGGGPATAAPVAGGAVAPGAAPRGDGTLAAVGTAAAGPGGVATLASPGVAPGGAGAGAQPPGQALQQALGPRAEGVQAGAPAAPEGLLAQLGQVLQQLRAAGLQPRAQAEGGGQAEGGAAGLAPGGAAAAPRAGTAPDGGLTAPAADAVQQVSVLLSQAYQRITRDLEQNLRRLRQVIAETEQLAARMEELLGQSGEGSGQGREARQGAT